MAKPKVVRFLFGWCKREEHDKCKTEKTDKTETQPATVRYICTCKHHTKNGPDLVEA